MDRLVTLLCALVLAAGAMAAWDRHPPLGWHAKLVIWTVGFDLPPSLAQRAAEAEKRAAQAALATGRCTAALNSQNASLAARSALDARKLAEAHATVAAHREQAAHYAAQAATLLASHVAAGDACPAWEAVDAEVKEALR